MNYITSPNTKVGFKNDCMSLGFGSLQRIVNDKVEIDIILQVLEKFLVTSSKDKVIRELCVSCSVPKKDLIKVIDYLIDNNFLVDSSSLSKSNRYNRNHLYFSLNGANPSEVQHKLKNAHVAIVGCGGIGNVISASLATAGIGKLSLVDHDIVELTNLNRQFLFSEDDVDLKKCDVLDREIKKRNSNVRVDVYDSRLTSDILNNLKDISLVVLSADSIDCLPTVNEFSINTRTPYINVGYVQDVSAWGPFVIPGVTGCCDCRDELFVAGGIDNNKLEIVSKINNNHQTASNSGVNMIAAANGFLDVIKFIGEFGEVSSLNKRIGIWTHNMTIEEQVWKKNPNCPSCSHI